MLRASLPGRGDFARSDCAQQFMMCRRDIVAMQYVDIAMQHFRVGYGFESYPGEST
jgi:hypothetical protein